jgi:hypothetical protein
VNPSEIQARPYADPDVAARKLIEIAHSVEPVQDGRIHIEKINWPFLHELCGSPAEYGAGIERAIAKRLVVDLHGKRDKPVCMKLVPPFRNRSIGQY